MRLQVWPHVLVGRLPLSFANNGAVTLSVDLLFRGSQLPAAFSHLAPVRRLPPSNRDDGASWYTGEFIHTPRVPEGLKGMQMLITDSQVGLLHFQYADWGSFLVKQVPIRLHLILTPARRGP